MKKFRFQAMLEYRKRIEEQIHQEFWAMQEHLAQETNKLLFIENQKADFQRQLSEKQKRDFCPAEIEIHQLYLTSIEEQKKEQEETILKLNLSLEKKREELLNASQEKKIMGKLREKAATAWQRELLLEEQKTLDEKSLRQFRKPQTGDQE